MVVIGHIGYFFIDDAQWWSVFGRMAAPVFFYLLGYAWSRKIPMHWLMLGFFLTLLDSWNNDWEWMAVNILFSMALIRFSRPGVLALLQRFGWLAFSALIVMLIVALPFAGEVVDYGSEGWLWALFGLCQRMFVDGSSPPASHRNELAKISAPVQDWGVMRLIACFFAATIYIWQEQIEFDFSSLQLAVVAIGVCLLALGLSLFVRGPSRFQPSGPISGTLRFLGRHTLEIYVIQLAGSELIINIWPDLAP